MPEFLPNRYILFLFFSHEFNREFIIVTKNETPPYAYIFKTHLDKMPNSVNLMVDTGIRLAIDTATDATSSSDGQVFRNFLVINRTTSE